MANLSMEPNEIVRMARASHTAEAELGIVRNLRTMRTADSELFVKTLFHTVRALGKDRASAVLTEFELSELELKFLFLETATLNRWPKSEWLQRWNEFNGQAECKPSGASLLVTALSQLLAENPKWKKYDLQRFVDARITSHFAKKPKPFTGQQFTDAVKWSIGKRKKIAEKKAETDNRSRSGVNIPKRTWEQFFRLQGWSESPEFADKFIKAVNAEVRKLKKGKAAQIATN